MNADSFTLGLYYLVGGTKLLDEIYDLNLTFLFDLVGKKFLILKKERKMLASLKRKMKICFSLVVTKAFFYLFTF